MKTINLIVNLALCAICIVAGVEIPKINSTPFILGGKNAEEGQFPHQVSIRRYRLLHICGGAIINNWYILTAAHCTQNADAKLLTVVIGTIKRFDDGVELNLAEIINHPKYNVFYYDIALLRTAQEIEFSELIKPIALPTYDSMKHGVKVVISGWGYTSYPDPVVPKILQYTEAQVFDLKKCSKEMNVKITESHICTSTQWGLGMCYGDSGGPLVDIADPNNKILVGIISFGYPCGTGRPDVFTRVYSYIDWINDVMEHKSNSASLTHTSSVLLLICIMLFI